MCIPNSIYFLAALIYLGAFPLGSTFSLPPPTGRYHVALTQHVLNHTTPNDPFAPNNTGTDILLSIYSPTLQQPTTKRPYLDAGLAAIYEAYFNFTPGFLANITTDLQWQALTLPANQSEIRRPTLVFGPPFAGPPSQCFTSLLSNLASHGYTILAIDHPYEQPFLQYPYGGPGITGLVADFIGNPDLLNRTHTYRVADTAAAIAGYQDLVDLYGAPFNNTHFITFGHSLGGSAAIASTIEMINNKVAASSSTKTKKRRPPPILVGSINLDGTFFGAPASSTPADSNMQGVPFLLMGSTGHNHTSDPTWASFEAAQGSTAANGQSGWWRELEVAASGHTDFTDSIFWKQWGGLRTPGPGVIEANRMAALTRTFVSAFFDMVTDQKKVKVLEKPSAEWPEVAFVAGKEGGC